MNFFRKFYFIITGLLVLISYLFTIAPSVLQTDTGELAAVQVTLGIAHPTGYPLYTLIGYLFSLIPLPFSKIFQLNLLAAIYCSISVSIFTYTAIIILNNLDAFKVVRINKNKQKRGKDRKNLKNTSFDKTEKLNEPLKIISAIFAGLILAFSKTFWIQSTAVEVYSFQLLLINLVILSLIKAFVYSNEDNYNSKLWISFAIFLALGFSNHMTTLLIIPGAGYLFFARNGFNIKSFRLMILMLLTFLPILILIYSYLPIRAAQNPLLNWGNPTDFEKIIRHITGKQYQVWIFSSMEAASKQLNYFLNNLPGELFISSLLIIIGLWESIRKIKRLFVFLLIVFLSTVIYSINYEISDIDSYFLLAYISLAFFSLIGIKKIFELSMRNKIKLIIPTLLLILLLAIQFLSNFNSVNQKQNHIYEDYTKSLLDCLPENSIVLSYQWDYFISASYYFQLVENFRKDVVVIDKELLRRSWYYHQIETNHPEILNDLQSEINGFLNAVKPFERGEVFNPNLIESYYRQIMTGLVKTNIIDHNFFIAPEIVENEINHGEFQLPEGYRLVPYLFLFKVVKTDDYVEAPLPDFKIRVLENKDKYVLSLERIIAGMFANRALYELHFKNDNLAELYVKKLTVEFKDYPLPPVLQNLINN